MAMNTDSSPDGIFEINITPFVDVVLVLLVIFMVTAPMMVQQALKVDLPTSKTSDALDVKTLSVGITAEGQYLLNGELVLLETLKNQSQNEFENNPSVQVIFSADLNSKHEATVKAMDVLRQTGITRFAFQIVQQD